MVPQCNPWRETFWGFPLRKNGKKELQLCGGLFSWVHEVFLWSSLSISGYLPLISGCQFVVSFCTQMRLSSSLPIFLFAIDLCHLVRSSLVHPFPRAFWPRNSSATPSWTDKLEAQDHERPFKISLDDSDHFASFPVLFQDRFMVLLLYYLFTLDTGVNSEKTDFTNVKLIERS